MNKGMSRKQPLSHAYTGYTSASPSIALSLSLSRFLGLQRKDIVRCHFYPSPLGMGPAPDDISRFHRILEGRSTGSEGYQHSFAEMVQKRSIMYY